MSAFICSDLHIASVAIKVADYFEINAQQLANKLKCINIKSVNFRYREKTRISKCELNNANPYNLSVHGIAALIDCLDYQSCEENSIDYKAYSTMLKLWIKENAAEWRNSLWTI